MPADIDECKTSNNTCMSEKHCRNTDGYYECFCPDGQSGNGTLADGCHKQDLTTKVAIGKHLSMYIPNLFSVIESFVYTRARTRLITSFS
jgi:hypothetical protein